MWSVLAKEKHCLSQSNKWKMAHLIIMWLQNVKVIETMHATKNNNNLNIYWL